MKKLGKILYYILAVGLALAVATYLIYEIVWQGVLDVSHILRTLLLVATMILAIYRVASGMGRGRKKHSEQFFRERYGDLIGNAFTVPSTTSKQFFKALDYYQYNQPVKLTEAMCALAPQCTNNDERFAVMLFMAIGYDEMYMYEKAAEAYEQALLYRENSTAASNLGLCYQRLGNYEKAIDAYRYAIKAEPENAYAYNNLAQVYIRREEYEEALLYADMAIERKENFREAYSAKALAYAMRGEAEAYENAVRKYALYGGDKNWLIALAKDMGAEIV